jgi:hypothetical protein
VALTLAKLIAAEARATRARARPRACARGRRCGRCRESLTAGGGAGDRGGGREQVAEPGWPRTRRAAGGARCLFESLKHPKARQHAHAPLGAPARRR